MLSLFSTGPAIAEVRGRAFPPEMNGPRFCRAVPTAQLFYAARYTTRPQRFARLFRTEYGGVQNWIQFDLGIAPLVLCVSFRCFAILKRGRHPLRILRTTPNKYRRGHLRGPLLEKLSNADLERIRESDQGTKAEILLSAFYRTSE